MMLPKGREFIGPDGQGYRLNADVDTASRPLPAKNFEPFGGAPEPVSHHVIPAWLMEQINAPPRDKHQILDL